ncbi:hypothetical protein DM01DRAFT_1330688 [Hesseltinella vesiculosa]|uniref:Centrosomin N-terminal motif 1 domain-containing protein n=1 Tax=Hesseltinella vesiculosa TaxID=101127 RepID=A0A1X2GWU9_9FUNG|nr:hypothetical protein DM01DRAFT_1330688 [Hesseltinella vesiculosa]
MTFAIHIHDPKSAHTRRRSASATSAQWEGLRTLRRPTAVWPAVSPSPSSSSTCSTSSFRHSASTVDSSRHTSLSRRQSLGKPPGIHSPSTTSSQSQQKPKPSPSTLMLPHVSPSYSSTTNNSQHKTAPMKELEKLLTDLKKENFDLKLRLFHLESTMATEIDKYWLQSENERLQADLQLKVAETERLEDSLLGLGSRLAEEMEKNKAKLSRDATTQTDDTGPCAPLSATTHQPSQWSTQETNTGSCLYPTDTVFPSNAAAFGLLSRPRRASLSHSSSMEMDSVADQFQQQVHIVTPNYRVQRWLKTME